MLARLDATFQAQKQFVADSSHELRSPLTVIKGNLELWRKARSEEDRQIAAAAIEQETARMTRLVENLLFLAQMEATPVRSAQPVLREPVELDSLLLTVYQQARAIGRGHQITLAHEDVVTVQGDRDQLQQLLLNLVDNAIKYTPTGGTISLGLYGAGDWARLEVSDTGIGIPTDDLPHIFDRFYRSDKARSRTMGGAGLGLAIVREVAEAHGGRVEVFSTPGEGTLFRVWLPRQAGQAALPDPAPGEALGLAFLPDEIPALPPGEEIAAPPVAPLLGRSSDEIRRIG
jgi:signal transduction histidine kinase